MTRGLTRSAYSRGGDHHAFRGPRALKGADEGLYDRPFDRTLPALSPDIDDVEAQLVLADDSVESLVSGPTQSLRSPRTAPAVPIA